MCGDTESPDHLKSEDFHFVPVDVVVAALVTECVWTEFEVKVK